MNMFQVIVIGMLIALFGGAGFYIVKVDRQGVLTKAVEGDKIQISEEKMMEISGVYNCDQSSGCKEPYTLKLNDDGTGELSASYQDGAEVVSEVGDWYVGHRGYITLNLLSNQTGNYDAPKTFLIRSVGTSTLSRIVYSVKQYQDMISPVFLKAQN